MDNLDILHQSQMKTRGNSLNSLNISPRQIQKSMRSSTGLGHAGALGRAHELSLSRDTF